MYGMAEQSVVALMNESEGARRVAECHANHQRRGLRLVRVWVPDEDVVQVREVAQELRRSRGLPLPSDTWGDWVWVRVVSSGSQHDSDEDAELRWRFSSAKAQRVGDEFWRVRESWVAALGIENRLVPDPETRVA